MTDEYHRIESDGSVSDRAQTLARYTPETRYWEKAEGDDYIVRVYGDTAIVIGRWTARGVNNGERFDYQARFLSVYVKENGEWRMIAEQSTEIKG
jgi:ketosteroid isomerase-like protein